MSKQSQKNKNSRKPPKSVKHVPPDLYDVAVRHYSAGRLAEAGNVAQTLLAARPDNPAVLNLAGIIASETHCTAEAEAAYRRALELAPGFFEVHNNLGNLLNISGRLEEAEAAYRKALQLKPDFLDAHNNLGSLLDNTGRLEEAEVLYRKALALNPNHPQTQYKMGTLLLLYKNRQAEALDCFERVVALQPDYPYAFGAVALCRAAMCDWSRYSETQERLHQGVREGKRRVVSLVYLNFCDDPHAQRRCAEIYAHDKFSARPARPEDPPRYRHPKIRLAYVSPDFHNHPVTHLIADLIERHDRSRFEVTGVSIGPPIRDEWRVRLENGFDRFLDMHGCSDEAVAHRLRELEIDIAVDLAGYTKNAEPAIFAHRAAPIQVNYLGYPGTLGTEFIDYLLADRFVIPEADEPAYVEKIVRLPDTFQCSAVRRIADRTPSRRELGLPDSGFVFCCFNNTYKIHPPLFDIWMRLLAQVPDSVLWLYQPNPAVENNLRHEAQARGIAPERLIFGPWLPPAEYLARYRQADLFLDTLPYNAGTTASDALWAGLPVVTCAGRAFAARMGGSLLRAAGLPELITDSLADYEALALHLATHPDALAALRRKLEQNHLSQPLFDVERFRRHIEAAYTTMWDGWQRGEPPTAFAVEPLEAGPPATAPGHRLAANLEAAVEIPAPEPSASTRQTGLDSYAAAVRLYFASQFEQARDIVQKLLATQPDHWAALNLTAVIAARTHRMAEAESAFRKIIQAKPDSPNAYNNLGILLKNAGRLDEAEAVYRKVLEIDPNYADVYSNLGNLLRSTGRLDEAETAYRKVLELNPNHANAHDNLGMLLFESNSRRAEALACFEQTLDIQPDYPYAFGMAALCRALQCDWSRYAETRERLRRGVRENARCTSPFTLLSSCDDPYEQRRCAEIYVQDKFSALAARSGDLPRHRHAKIRLAYVSPDFHNHPVAHLIADLIERHDRTRFEVIGVSLGLKVHDEWRTRLEQSFDRFLDVHGDSDTAVARRLRELEIDIAVDLAGDTRNARTGIFAQRAAPIQVNYLGYPGTLGAEFIDYLLADRFVIPEADESAYAERIVRLPDSFQCSALRHIADRTPTRQEFGLPEHGFVFCCFNNTYKIQPTLFDVWMRLLNRVPGSVLWLYKADAAAEDNLRREAQARGIAPERLVFGARLPLPEYLARYRRADLFLDTLPYNAGTTASDALWAGLPVLTCAGRAFAARMGGSLLRAAGLPELITDSLADYEALALHLATHPDELAALRRKLEQNRLSQPLFDVERFRRHLEAAYTTMWDGWQRGEPPTAFAVERLEDNPPATVPTRLRSGHPEAASEKLMQKSPASTQHADTDLYAAAVRHYLAGQLEAARDTVRALLAAQPEHVAALNLSAMVAARTHRPAEAEAAYRRALALDPNLAEVHNNLGALLKQSGRRAEAEAAYRRALEIDPNHADAHHNLGLLLFDKNSRTEALACFERTLAVQPDYPYAFNMIALCRAMLCDWSRHAETQERLLRGIREKTRCAQPFTLLSACDDPHEQRRCAEIYVQDKFPARLSRSAGLPRHRHAKIRLAYISPDFHNHPVAHLIADLIERHDRARFEVIGVSLGPKVRDEWRTRLERSFDRFLDVHGDSDAAVAHRLRELEIDIAVDLAGHTKSSRPDIFAQRAAPIQVNYLGYPGTLGAEFIDYLLADRFVIPEADESAYAEKIVRLPDSFQSSALRRISERTPPRQEFGLPEHGFVFCCFNNPYKIQPPVFDVWMRLLAQVPGSILWLYRDDAAVESHLRREAQARGIAPERLVFGARLPLPEYLARYRRADLFLDTLPYNAGTTASDALWAGLPVVTCAGRAFAARMGGSLLRAAGLPELITDSLADYEALALHLATHPDSLAALRRKLEQNRLSQPLFDVERFRRHLEAAYATLWDIWQRGEPPTAFTVDPIEGTMPTNSASNSAPASQPAPHSASPQPVLPGRESLKKVLHVGCGPARRERMPKFFHTPDWQEVRLDIDPACQPDIVASMVEMTPVAPASVAALFSSHNLEHLYPHEVPRALAEFHRVLRPDGFALITLPDLQSVAALVAQDRLEDTAYVSPAGPITPLDILYGHRASMARGNLFMAHRTGFTAKTLVNALQKAGFPQVTVQRDNALNLWAIAFMKQQTPEQLAAMQQALLPLPVREHEHR